MNDAYSTRRRLHAHVDFYVRLNTRRYSKCRPTARKLRDASGIRARLQRIQESN